MPEISLIVGLGNPGAQYQATRHNAGYWFADRLLETFPGNLQQKDKFFGRAGTLLINGKSVHVLKPQTFMNLSGKSVLALSSFYRIAPQNMLIAHDELDIDSGELRLKFGGGHGGHNGLRDICRCLGNDFYRLRIGIGHPGLASQVTGHVLNKPAADEKQLIDQAIDQAVTQTPSIITGDMEAVMQQLHSKRD